MLDLNVSSPEDGGQVDGAPVSAGVYEPATSNSSVLNAEGSSNAADEESCSTRSAGQALRFGILKDGGDDDTEEVEEGERFVEEEVNNSGFVMASSQSQFVTRQLLPLAVIPGSGYSPRAAEMVAQMAPSSSVPEPHWFGFSFRQSGVAAAQQQQQQQQQVKKSRRGPRSRSSQYRGVTFYRRTGRWESHIWDCGKQVYLGGFDTAHSAARAYDRAAIKFRGVDADINFNLSDYDEDLKQMRNLTKEEFVHALRRQSTGFSRGSSKYRGVTLHKCGRWEARMGQFLGKK
ncbi:hypothetical protein Taro_009720 [Colocasia esculenta]|uniref:AP2/ERF domain-containing protein n=1 Tax=Colocasia esculenta TaxID=4460 RepID=A0A843U1B0_COLES|nr:hypothetical protein [Colocasia esculenta]